MTDQERDGSGTVQGYPGLPPLGHALSEEPCPRCLPVAYMGRMWLEALGRLAVEVAARPLAHDGSGACCDDCRAADALQGHLKALTWEMARVAVGNDRCEQLRLCGIPLGLVLAGYMHPNQAGDFEKQHAWLVRAGLVKPDETPSDNEGRWRNLRVNGSPRVATAVSQTGTASCYKCGQGCDVEECFCSGCGEVTCEACEVNHTLMGQHDVEDHYTNEGC